jgi:nucleoside-diphosphate-sugar epimerase
MARVVIIGVSGDVGTYFVPALVERGHEVVNVSRGTAALLPAAGSHCPRAAKQRRTKNELSSDADRS